MSQPPRTSSGPSVVKARVAPPKPDIVVPASNVAVARSDVAPLAEVVASAQIVPVDFYSPWRGSRTVTKVTLPPPPIGGKAWLMNRKGIFVLEEGCGVLRTIACTHIGSGSMIIRSGLPNVNGEFGAPPTFAPGEEGEYNGRQLFRANPVVMGSWMLDAGFVNGLTVQADGGMDNNCAIATIVWLPAPMQRRA